MSTPDHRVPTPAGLLVAALAPSSYDDYDVITAVVDRLPVDLIAQLAQVIARSRDRAQLRAIRQTADLLAECSVSDAQAYAARSRLGYRSTPYDAPLPAAELVELEDQAARYIEGGGPV